MAYATVLISEPNLIAASVEKHPVRWEWGVYSCAPLAIPLYITVL